MILDLFLKKNFLPDFYYDLATENSNFNEIYPNIFRRFFIIVFCKKDHLMKLFKTKKIFLNNLRKELRYK